MKKKIEKNAWIFSFHDKISGFLRFTNNLSTLAHLRILAWMTSWVTLSSYDRDMASSLPARSLDNGSGG